MEAQRHHSPKPARLSLVQLNRGRTISGGNSDGEAEDVSSWW
jgi:hypothetical protein